MVLLIKLSIYLSSVSCAARQFRWARVYDPFSPAVVLGFRILQCRNLSLAFNFENVMRLCNVCVNKWLFEVPADL